MPTFTSFDGTEIDDDDTGSGPPVLLLHGFAANRQANWVRPKVPGLHGDHPSAVGDPAFRQAIVDLVASVPGVEPSSAAEAA